MFERKQIFTLIGICLAGFVAFLDFTIVNTALPVLQKDLQIGMIKLQWVLNIYFIVLATLMVILGRLGDKLGMRRVYLTGITIFIFASALAACAPNGDIVILGRMLQAIGAAVIFPISASLITVIFKEKNTKALGIYGAICGAGLAAGPLLGALLTTAFGWRSVFMVNVPIGLLGLMICFMMLPKTQGNSSIQINVVELLLFIVGIVGIVCGIIFSSQYGWTSAITLVSLLVGIIVSGSFFYYESGRAEPLLEPDLLVRPMFLLGALSCMIGGILSGIALFFLPLYLHSLRGVSTMMTGVILFSITGAYTLFSTQVNRVHEKCGLVNTILIGMFAAVIASVLQYCLTLTSSIYFIIVPCCFIGIAWAIGNILSVVAAHQSVSEDKVGVATGMVFTLFDLGGSIALSIAVVVFKAFEKLGLDQNLVKAGVQLSPAQHEHITAVLADPKKLEEAVSHLGTRSHELIMVVRASFIDGFHAAVTVLVIISIISLLLSLYARHRHVASLG